MTTERITDFLEARIAEDEAAAATYKRFIHQKTGGKPSPTRGALRMPDPRRLLADCAAKRAILQYVAALRIDRLRDAETDAQYRSAWWVATKLASAYKDHPDYQQEWEL